MGSVKAKRVHDMPGRPSKHRLSPAKIPHALNTEFEAARAVTGDTHTQAVEAAIRLYVEVTARGRKDGDTPIANAGPGTKRSHE